jgi:SAM-dependent methyltransferase
MNLRGASESIKSEYVACDLCGAVDHEVLYSKTDSVTKWTFNVVACSCGMVFVNPMPLEQSIPLLYRQDYHFEKPLLDSLYKKMIELLPPSNENSRLLDVGCGTGDFIKHAQEVGWNAEGVDLINWGQTYEGLKIRIGDLLCMDIPQESYDVVTAWAVLEHVKRPSLFFRKISILMKKRGYFIFTVPNVAAPGIRHSCHEDVPRHLWLFTPGAVEEYLNKNGMRIESIFHDGKIYRSYPFGLLKYAGYKLIGRKQMNCSVYENRSIALLQNRSINVHFKKWMAEVFENVPRGQIALDFFDIALGIIIATYSKMIKNYGVITVIATRQ